MKLLVHWLVIGVVSTLATTAEAVTTVEQRDGQGHTQKIIINESYAYMGGPKPSLYMLVNMKTNKMYIVNSEKREAIEKNIDPNAPVPQVKLPPQMTEPPKTAPVETKLVEKGIGPVMAGYPTVQYQITANGQPCSDVYLSTAVADVAYVQKFTKVMDGISQRAIKTMPFAPPDPCAQARTKLLSEYLEHGALMKHIGNDGKVTYEVLSIKTDAEKSAEVLKTPQELGYKVVTEEEAMSEMKKRVEEMQRNQGSQGNHGNMVPPGHPNIPPHQPQDNR